MASFLYAATDEEGDLNKVVDFLEELTWDQKVELGVKDFVDEPVPSDFDANTQKIGSVVVIETTDLIVRKREIVQKTDKDLFQDKMLQRQLALPMPEVSIVSLARMMDRLIRTVELQMEPGDPKTHLDIPQADKDLLVSILEIADGTADTDPQNPDLPPGGDAPDSTRAPPPIVDPVPV